MFGRCLCKRRSDLRCHNNCYSIAKIYIEKGILFTRFFNFTHQTFNRNGLPSSHQKFKPAMEQKIHQGRNVKRFREMLGIKQEALAFDLGEDWNQKKISLLEQKDVIEADMLKQISAALKIPVEAFQNFDEEQAVNLISCTFSDNAMFNNRIEVQNINPIDHLTKLHEEKIALYERMLKEKDEMMVRLEKLINNRISG